MARPLAIGILLSLAGLSALAHVVAIPADTGGSDTSGAVWAGFLYWLPLLLAGLVFFHLRWAFMVAVMYGTIGLALDLSTLAYGLTHEGTGRLILFSGTTGLLNAALTAIGWQGFIGGHAAVPPPGVHPPNPPSRPSV